MILIVASEKDVASRNIAQKIIEGYNFEGLSETFMNHSVYCKNLGGKEIRLVTIEDEPIFAQYIPYFFKTELIIFVSRHESRSGIPTLSVHTPGNLVSAEFGGLPRSVSISPANSMRRVLLEMVIQKEKLGLDDFNVSYECTHHGPSLDVPAMFVEVGSSLREWENPKAGEAVAHAAIASIINESIVPAVLGIGGPHYNQRFTEISLEHNVAFGHIIPKYVLQNLDSEILRHCIERTVEKVQTGVLDWKGIGSKDRGRVIGILKENHLEIRKTKDFH